MIKKLKWIICLICLFTFGIFAYLVKTKKDIFIDSLVYNFISKYIFNDLTYFVKYFTYLGSATIVIIITLFVIIFFKNKKYGLYMSLNLLIITLFQFILKSIFSRSRPIEINLIEETGYSFPSGHSLTSMAFYGFIIYLLYTSKVKYKKIYITIISIIILLIGLSRIYLGVHYTSDVISGFCFSISYLIIFTNIIKGTLKN